MIADGARDDAPADETAQLAAVAELAVVAALSRTYGVHVAPRIPEAALHLALGSYIENLEPGERVVALYDPSLLTGHGDRGVLLTDRRVWTSAQPRRGAYSRDIDRLQLVGGGFLSSVGIDVEGLELRFHTKAVRDARRRPQRGVARVPRDRAGAHRLLSSRER